MTRIVNVFMILMAAVIFTVFSFNAKADVTEPGSNSDPLVSKSYVDKVLHSMKQYVDSRLGSSANYEIVYLEQNQELIGDMGTEIILRSGIAAVVDSGNGGLADVTAGKDTSSGEAVMQNHLLIVPRDDSRGIKAENNSVIVLVRGSYTIK